MGQECPRALRRGVRSGRESEMLEFRASYPAFSEPCTLHLPKEVDDGDYGRGGGWEGGNRVNDPLLSHSGK